MTRLAKFPVSLLALLIFGCALLASCKKKNPSGEAENYQALEKTLAEDTKTGAAAKDDAPKEPVQGVDLSAMSKQDQARFNGLVDQLESPCGKAHSLRTSRNTDASCVRAKYAVNLVAETLKDGAVDEEISQIYKMMYSGDKTKQGFTLEGRPHKGPDDAPVVLVEFFDYGCPACKAQKPVFEGMVKEFPGDVALYYKMFPLSAHVNSPGAAQAALAAHAQGKFEAMHEKLFSNQQAHSKAQLDKYSKELNLNQKNYKADFEKMAAMVQADRQEGESAKVAGTPALFINGVLYEGPNMEKYVKMAVEEAIALSR